MEKLTSYVSELRTLLSEFQEMAHFKRQDLIVLGASSSEIAGKRIGTATNEDISSGLLPVVQEWADQHDLFLAVQGCEHINRSLVVEKSCSDYYGLDLVNVVPHLKAGGGFATVAIQFFTRPAMVESLQHKAHGGIDIGSTLIGMHLRRVAVPMRLSVREIGAAPAFCAYTRLPMVGGERARYSKYDLSEAK